MLKAIPKNKDSFGLIHADLHSGNFLITPKYKITSFDYDDSCYNYFIYDISICLMRYYNSRKFANKHHDFKYNQFFSKFKSGYNSENKIERSSWKMIPNIIRLRNVEMYSWFHKMIGTKNLSDENKKFLEYMKAKIEDYQGTD